jgi:peptidoglycan/xylan/chitin deacetylase (PgdA/CDA1 family)
MAGRPVLRVLCYHQVHPSRRTLFTVTTAQLDSQLSYLVRSGFRFITVRDLLTSSSLPKRPLLLSFDDGYSDNYQYLQPVLRRHGAKATIFLVTGHVGDCARWNDDQAPLMGLQELRDLDSDLIEFALHSHSHRAFDELSIAEVEDDLRSSLQFFTEHRLPVTPALAFPYGARPKRRMVELSHTLASLGIRVAFRLGNRINPLPLRRPYEIQRINVTGLASVTAFKAKVWFGKPL